MQDYQDKITIIDDNFDEVSQAFYEINTLKGFNQELK